jgi:hypothetical protein
LLLNKNISERSEKGEEMAQPNLKEYYVKWLDDHYLATISSGYLRLMDAAESVAQANGLTELSFYDIPLPQFYEPLAVDILNLLSDTQITDENYLKLKEALDVYGEFLEEYAQRLPADVTEDARVFLERQEQKRAEREAAESARREEEKRAMLELFSQFATELDEDPEDEEAEDDLFSQFATEIDEDGDLSADTLFSQFATASEEESVQPHGLPYIPYKADKTGSAEAEEAEDANVGTVGYVPYKPDAEHSDTKAAVTDEEKSKPSRKTLGYVPYKTDKKSSMPVQENKTAADAAGTDESNVPESPKTVGYIPFRDDKKVLAQPENRSSLKAPQDTALLEGSSTIPLEGPVEMGGTIEMPGTVSSMVLEDKRAGQAGLHAPQIDGMLAGTTDPDVIEMGGTIELGGTIEMPADLADQTTVVPEAEPAVQPDSQVSVSEEITLSKLMDKEFSQPAAFTLGSREAVKADNWQDLYVKALNELIPLNRIKMNALTGFCTSDAAIKKPALLANGRIVETDLSAETVLQNLKAVMDLCLLPSDSLKLYFADDHDES